MSLRAFAAALAVLTLSACGGSDLADLEDYAERVKARDPGPIEPLPEIEQVDTFVYEPADRRDPFVMDEQSAQAAPEVIAASTIAPDPLRRKEELEQYALDSLRMLGSLQQDDAIWGLVSSPDGVLHRVRVGNYMGLNNGQVTRISEQKIELTEIVPDGPNSWRERQAAIALSQ
jgi:type IV pilus assembly protein PilP